MLIKELDTHTCIAIRFLKSWGFYNCVIFYRSEDCTPFDIVSAYPNKIHSNDAVTLLDAGLTPNAVALLKTRKS